MPVAQRLLHLGSGASDADIRTADGANVEAVRGRLTGALGAQYDVSSSHDVAAASAAAAKTQVGYLQTLLLAMAAASLLVGAFLIANTFSMVVASRTREIAVLRAAGATGRQILGSILVEALLIGTLASAAGAALGVAVAAGLRSLLAAFGTQLPNGPLAVDAATLAGSALIGVLVTVLAALGPARRASRVSPLAALRSSAAPSGGGRARAVAGLVAVLLGGAAVATAVRSGSVAFLAVGGVLGLTGLVLAGPAIVAPLMRLLGGPLGRRWIPARLARESAARAPRRTSATAMALAIGLALISFMSVLAASVKDSVASGYRETIKADYVIESSRNEMLGGVPTAVSERVAALPQVAVASRLRYGHWKDGATTSALTAVDPATLPAVTNLHLVQGRLSDLASGGIVLAEHIARERHLALGDTLPMTFARTGRQNLRIVGLLRDQDADGLSTGYLISLATFGRNYSENVDASVFVKLADGVDSAAGGSSLARRAADYPTVDVRDQGSAVAGRLQAIDQVLGMVTVLLLLTVVIATMGIANTLALSMLERTREIGLLPRRRHDPPPAAGHGAKRSTPRRRARRPRRTPSGDRPRQCRRHRARTHLEHGRGDPDPAAPRRGPARRRHRRPRGSHSRPARRPAGRPARDRHRVAAGSGRPRHGNSVPGPFRISRRAWRQYRIRAEGAHRRGAPRRRRGWPGWR